MSDPSPVKRKADEQAQPTKQDSEPQDAHKTAHVPKSSPAQDAPTKPTAPTATTSKAITDAAKRPKLDVSDVFGGEESDDDEESMPLEARIRMRNLGKFTPTSAGPNSFGKSKVGFTDPQTRKLQWVDPSKNPNKDFVALSTPAQAPQAQDKK